MRHRFPTPTIIGLAVVLLTVVAAVVGSDVAGAAAFLGLFLFATGVWHGVRGTSWLTPLLPQGRRVGAGGIAVGMVVMVMAGAATPATGTESVGPTPSAPASLPSNMPSVSVAMPPISASPVPSVSGTIPPSAPVPSDPETVPGTATEATGAAAALASLEMKGRAPKTGYSREEFGPRWADTDRNGCDTRNDILRRDLTDVVAKPGTRDCVILSGTLLDPYTGTAIVFLRGQDTSTEVQIDHVVALSDAWQKGAQQLDAEARQLFANDPLNLLAVQGRANQQKGDGDAATWLPAAKSFRCQYVARQVAVKSTYNLWMTQAEHDASARILSACPDEPLPIDKLTPQSTDETAPSQVTTTPAASTPATEVYYENCTAAREAGAAPLQRGEPGYRSGLDGDDDRVACE